MLSSMTYLQQVRWFKRLVFLICCLPIVWLAWQGYNHHLGANPIEAAIHETGLWALRFLLITLAATPMRRFLGWYWPTQLRRMLGLFAFFYACLHLTSYVYLDQYFAWTDILEDILMRPYIALGMSAWFLLLPLAVTSSNKMIKRLGGKHWSRLHKLVYVIATLGILHYALLIKAGWSLAAPYIVVFIILMVLRMPSTSKI